MGYIYIIPYIFIKLFIKNCLYQQVYKVLVSVGSNEWFVFRRYAEFDKLYNTVSREVVLKLVWEIPLNQFLLLCCTSWLRIEVISEVKLYHMTYVFQLRKQFPTMNLKIPAKRIFGDNFDPGKQISFSSHFIFKLFLHQ